jgi:hypothetical protein
MATVARVVWGLGVEPKCLTDRTQMSFTIIPLQGGSGEMITGGKETKSRQPKGRRDKIQAHKRKVKK